MKKNMKLLKKEVKTEIKHFIKKGKRIRTQTEKKQRLVQKLKEEYDHIKEKYDEMLQIETDKANEEAGLEAEAKFEE